MTTNAWWVFGSSLKLGDGGDPTEVFTKIAEVRDIQPPQPSRDEVDVTNQDSPSPGWREFIAGWRDGGTLTFDLNWIPSDATQDETTGLYGTFLDNDLHNYELDLPTAINKTISFSAFLSGFNPDLPLEEQGQLSVDAKISGAVAIADTV